LTFSDGDHLPAYVAPLGVGGPQTFVVFPLMIKQRLAGTITLGLHHSSKYDLEDLQQARQISDQVTVALSNARLLEELEMLNWGTLEALSRTVDAKSSWTAGHSERVTEMAIKIARVMGLEDEAINNLHRGALLHDIGKIGISVSILDKREQLTEEELKTIESHPDIGARILEPIGAFADVVQFVLEHHEHFDGSGYPKGLARDNISLGGRILALADAFDAMVSDRPYRAGMKPEQVIETIRKEAERQFDPRVVEAFMAVIAEESLSEDHKTFWVGKAAIH